MNLKTVIIALLVIVVLGASGTAYYFYSQYQHAQEQLKNPDRTASEQTQAVINRIGKLINLPPGDGKDNEPTLATVQDKTKLKEQAFYKDAENGDQLLVYIKAKQAFLYRPSTNKLINVGPLIIGDQGQATPSATPTPSPTARR